MKKVKVFNRIYIGNQQYQMKDAGEALFHCWGSAYDEFESGPGNYTIAIIERADGKVETVQPEEIQFIN